MMSDNKEKNAAPEGEKGKTEIQKKDRRIYILSREKPELAVIKLGVPLTTWWTPTLSG